MELKEYWVRVHPLVDFHFFVKAPSDYFEVQFFRASKYVPYHFRVTDSM